MDSLNGPLQNVPHLVLDSLVGVVLLLELKLLRSLSLNSVRYLVYLAVFKNIFQLVVRNLRDNLGQNIVIDLRRNEIKHNFLLV